MNVSISNVLEINKKEFLIQMGYMIFGSMIYAVGLNFLIVPLGLYNGGFLGVAQLIRTFFINGLHLPIPSSVDLSGIIYFLMNVPLFFMGYRIMGKGFAVRALLGVGILSACLVIVPIPSELIIEDYLTSCIIGGIATGVGSGLILRGRGTAGGGDIIGVCCSKLNPNITVGRIGLILNLIVYGICLFMFNVEIVVYSVIFATVFSLAVDKVHIQNINMSVMIFTKKLGISDAIMTQLGRGVTNWDGEGAYTHKTAYILFVVISKYEVAQIRKIVHSIDPHAFMIFTEGCSIDGNFEKRL
jgi:uncharacterized membrane-anchored protein YitT (DUF2179 family)